MKTVTLIEENGRFRLNGLSMQKSDLVLCLNILGFDVTPCPSVEFYFKALRSLSSVCQTELDFLLTSFKVFNVENKTALKHKLAMREILEYPICEN